MEDKLGKLIAICTSEKKGTQKQQVETAVLTENHGIEGDAHAGNWHRQVSLLGLEKIEAFRERGAEVAFGAFGENLVVEGFDFRNLPVGTRFRIGDVLLEEHTPHGKGNHAVIITEPRSDLYDRVKALLEDLGS